MSNGYAEANGSILLDYLSPLLFISFLTALKRRHFLVTFTIIGFVLIKVLIILSTGLLVLQNIWMGPVNVKLQTSGKFDGNGYQALHVDASPALATLAIEHYGMDYPMFSSAQYAIQPFEIPAIWSGSSSAELKTIVPYFAADLDCEEAVFDQSEQIQVVCPPMESSAPDILCTLKLSVSTPTCNSTTPPIVTTLEGTEDGVFSGYSGTLQRVMCSQNIEVDSCGRPHSLTEASDIAELTRSLIHLTYVEYNTLENKTQLLYSTILLCRPVYETGEAEVRMNRTTTPSKGMNVRPIPGTQHQRLDHLAQADLATSVILSTSYLDGFPPSVFDLSSVPKGTQGSIATSQLGQFDAFFNLVLGLDSQRPLQSLSDAQVLLNRSRTIYRSVTAQGASLYFSSPANEIMEATYIGSDNRIVAQQVTTRLMQGVCAVVVLVCIISTMFLPGHCAPRSIGCLAGVVAVCGLSKDVMTTLKGTGRLSLSRLEDITSKYNFRTIIDQGEITSDFCIEEDANPHTARGTNHNSPIVSSKLWWRPIPLSMPVMILTVVAP